MNLGNVVTAPHSPLRLIVAAGGTGGHLFPALAVVEQLESLTDGVLDVAFLGSEDRMEARLIPSYGYAYTAMPIQGFKGLRNPSTLMLPWRIAASEWIAYRTLKQFKPDVVLVTGAYISYPVGRVAARMGIPLVLIESNVNPGKTNTVLAPKATAIIATFDESRALFKGVATSRIHVLGNPVRQQILDAPEMHEARRALGLSETLPTVLVVGGSLGARSMNHSVQAMVDRWAATSSQPPYQMLWQTGDQFASRIPVSLQERVHAMPFVDSMGAAYAAADLVVCRSGATTIAELGVMGKPAILIPLPSASTNEQRRNADVVARRGAAVIVDDRDLAVQLADVIEAVLVDERRRTSMADAMKSLGKPHAASEAARLVLQLASH